MNISHMEFDISSVFRTLMYVTKEVHRLTCYTNSVEKNCSACSKFSYYALWIFIDQSLLKKKLLKKREWRFRFINKRKIILTQIDCVWQFNPSDIIALVFRLCRTRLRQETLVQWNYAKLNANTIYFENIYRRNPDTMHTLGDILNIKDLFQYF